jgi:hypothetical protein
MHDELICLASRMCRRKHDRLNGPLKAFVHPEA